MDIKNIIIFSLILIVVLGLIINLSILVRSWVKHFRDIDHHNEIADAHNLLKINNDITLGDRINYSVNFIELINVTIDNEINKIIRKYSDTNEEYKMLKIDDDIKNISNNVCKSFKQDIFSHKDLIYTDDYIVKLVVSNTTERLINTAREYNNNRRNLLI